MSYEPEARQKQNLDMLYFQGAMCAKKNACFFTFFKHFFKLFFPCFDTPDQIWFFCPVLNSVFGIFSVLLSFFCSQCYKNLCKNGQKRYFHFLSTRDFPYFTICFFNHSFFAKATIQHHLISLDIILKKQKTCKLK